MPTNCENIVHDPRNYTVMNTKVTGLNSFIMFSTYNF